MLGERLAQLRKERDLTQEQLAKIFNMSRSTYAQYEVDRRHPDYNTLKMIAEYFNVSTDYLLGRTDDPSPRKDVRDVFTPEVLAEHGVEYAEVSDYLKKNGITDREAVEMLKEIDDFRKRMIAKYVEKS